MTWFHYYFVSIVLIFEIDFKGFVTNADGNLESENNDLFKQPTVVISILIRNKAHSLAWFFGHLERLNYPKERITLWIRSDHNIDNSSAIITEWTNAIKHYYHDVDIRVDEKQKGYTDERSPCDWTEKRFSNVIHLRQKAIEFARNVWADFLFMVDADIIVRNPDTLGLLMRQRKAVASPMLNSSDGGLYSNFWGALNEKGFYRRSDDYLDLVERRKIGCFSVPLVHSAVLFDMRRTESYSFSYLRPAGVYQVPYDDIIILAHNIRSGGSKMHILNTEYFGMVIMPLDHRYSLDDEQEHFDYVLLEANVFSPPLPRSAYVYHVPRRDKDKLGFEQVYMLNLVRRWERRERMMNAFDILGVDVKLTVAVDGKELSAQFLDENGVKQLPGYSDPYSKRPMTMGEIGCFLSHYHIWQGVVEKGFGRILLFEDDIRFEPFFRKRLFTVMAEMDQLFPDWDLLYLGRKRLHRELESSARGSRFLVKPHYSYWTLSYALSNSGARKLLAQKPLSKMVPVDEYLPIMMDRHPENRWSAAFEPRDLNAFSVKDFLVYPTHYTGEADYVSDTEESDTSQVADDRREICGSDGVVCGGEAAVSPREDL